MHTTCYKIINFDLLFPSFTFFSDFTDGVNVDWPGWCFDDDEVMDHLRPGGEGFMESISRSLAFLDIHRLSEQEDGEYSQV